MATKETIETPQQRVNEVGYLPPSPTNNVNPSISLKEYFDSQILEKEKRYEQRFLSQQDAVLKAEAATEKRFESVNEFRDTLKDQQITFATKTEVAYIGKSIEKNQNDINDVRLGLSNFLSLSEYTLRHAELQAQVTILRDEMNTNQGKTSFADPAIEEKFAIIVKSMAENTKNIASLQDTRSVDTGKSTQSSAIYGWILGGLGALVSLVLLALRFAGK